MTALPEVWLSNSHDVYLCIRAFGEYRTTRRVSPDFPLIFHESFRFEKTFYAASDSLDVARRLEAEVVDIELVQYDRFYDGVVKLASFSTNAREFLFPYPSLSPSYSSASKEVVLFRSYAWQGVSPKLEFSVRTSITREPLTLTRTVCYTDTMPYYPARYIDEDTEVEQLTSRLATSYLSTPRIRPRSAGASYSTYYRARSPLPRSPVPCLTAADRLEIELAAERARAKARTDALLSLSRSTTPTRPYSPAFRRSYDDTYVSRSYRYYPRYYN